MKLEGPKGPCPAAQPLEQCFDLCQLDFSLTVYFAHGEHAADVYSVL